MDKDTVINAIRFLEQRLIKSGLNVSKIILFGSHAREQANEESDVDIIIISEDFQDKDIFERCEMTKEAEVMTIREFLIPIDIITMTPQEFEDETSLIAVYAKNGMVISST
ncbi:MAG: nucleotidyltransferase domain-containing protein [Candidatus Poribacteria bacterium]